MYRVVWDGTLIAESVNTIEVEGNQYFPKEDVNTEYLGPSNTRTTCPWKGEAEYFHLVKEGKEKTDAAWSYPQPKEEAQKIAGHIAFDKGKVEITRS